MYEAVVRAEAIAGDKSDPRRQLFRTVLTDVAWNKTPLARELLALCRDCDWHSWRELPLGSGAMVHVGLVERGEGLCCTSCRSFGMAISFNTMSGAHRDAAVDKLATLARILAKQGQYW